MGEAVVVNGVDKLPAFAPFDFFARHKENEKEILRVYRTTATDVEAGETITPAAEWLLDNHYIVEEAIQEESPGRVRECLEHQVLPVHGFKLVTKWSRVKMVTCFALNGPGRKRKNRRSAGLACGSGLRARRDSNPQPSDP